MAEVNAKDLTTKTTPASTDSMLLFGTTSNEGAKITVDNLADNILGRLSTKTFPNQVGGSSAATLLAQLSTLNSNSATMNHSAYTPTFTNCGTIERIQFYYYQAGKFLLISGRFHVTAKPTETSNLYARISLPSQYDNKTYPVSPVMCGIMFADNSVSPFVVRNDGELTLGWGSGGDYGAKYINTSWYSLWAVVPLK